MKIFNLGQIPAEYLEKVGGKARGLDQLIKLGFNVPAGFVLINIKGETDIDAAVRHWKSSGLPKVAVRSSATAEDGAEFSFAGQFETFLGVQTEKNFITSVRGCLKSLDSVTGQTYADTAGIDDIKMCVVVQQMVDADRAGVCFTVSPDNKDELLIESVEGLGESLVSGEKAGKRLAIKRDSGNKSDIFTDAMRMEELFGFPVDCEWAVKNGTLWWLQARPITAADDIDEHELDTPVNLDGQIITRCNVGEMLPGAVTPLTLSLSVYAIDWGMRKMLTTAGAYKKMDNIPPYSCVLPVCNHLFINLSSIYPMTKCVLFATKQDVDYSICGRKIDAECEIIGRRKGFFKRFFNTYKYLGFVMSKNKAKKKITKLANTFSICDSADPQILYDNITGAKHNADIATYYHYATSSHSGSMSSAVFNILERKLHDTEKCKGVLAELLEDIDGIESVDILRSLRKISASGNSQELIDEFMRRHGHRAIREAELRSRGWADDRDAFNEYLRAVSAGSAEIEKTVSADIKQILKRHGFRGMMLGLMKFLAGQSRIGVSNREHSKSMMIKVYNVFKTAYRNLAKLLVGRNLIPDEDLIFFFTHEEIQTVISGEGQSLIKRAIKRRRLLDTQMGLFFEEVYMGKPQPLDQSAAADGATSFTGAAISRGTASGRARVVKTMADAAQLKNGEIMVCTFTDIGWSPYYALIGGLVTEIGSSLSHGAVVAREYGLPLVSNIKGATKIINTGDSITINGTTGTVTIISSGGQTE